MVIGKRLLDEIVMKNVQIKNKSKWPKQKLQKIKQRSTKQAYKTKDQVTRIPLKTGCELRFSGRVSSSCSTSDKWSISVVICDTDIPKRSTKSWWRP